MHNISIIIRILFAVTLFQQSLGFSLILPCSFGEYLIPCYVFPYGSLAEILSIFIKS
jgi:hypothetical protein